MAAAPVAPFVSVEDYLRMTFEYDAEYVDGRIEERPVPEFDHADMIAQIIMLLRPFAKKWGVRITGDPRTQTMPTRFRLPDVCVTSAAGPREQILRTAPLLCVEVLSPEDRLNRMKRKAEEYLAMGVRAVWIVDTGKRVFHVMTSTSDHEVSEGTATVPGTQIQIDILQAFSTLDE
jgi:Uma2 family endonuclease